MDSKNLFTNTDIISFVWKNTKADDMKKNSLISKEFYHLYKQMTYIDFLFIKYNDSGNLTLFIKKITDEICKKYKYAYPKFIPFMVDYFDKKKDKNINDKTIYLIYYWILLILHTINRNYEELFIQIRKIDYTNILDKNTFLFFIEILNEKRRTIYGKLYSQKTLDFINCISATHLILFLKNSFKNDRGFCSVLERKKKDLVQKYKNFKPWRRSWIYPKYLCLGIVEMIEK
tara:strand:+ start:170 stop:862 length:693 start_codon:yes stop_codon:yes gene_type:complete